MSEKLNQGRMHASLLLLRISMGGLMLTHGWPKFEKLLAGDWSFTDPLGLGEVPSFLLTVLAEFVGSILLVLGFYSRVGAFLLSATMFVAAFVHHAGDPIGDREKALLYLAGFVVILIVGGGRYSLDATFGKKR